MAVSFVTILLVQRLSIHARVVRTLDVGRSQTSPILTLNHGTYIEVTWQNGIVQITTNTGERYQHFGVSRSAAIAFAKNPDNKDLIKGRRLERVRG